MNDANPATVAYIGLGSNLDEPRRQVRRALAALAQLPHSRLLAASSLYLNPPLGPPDQPDYVNAVAAIVTRLSPLALLDALQRIEQGQQRRRSAKHWGPRTLDLDLLLYGQQQLTGPRLTVPHYGLHERTFVLYPLAEIAPDLRIPGHGALTELLARCPGHELTRLPDRPLAQDLCL